MLFFFANEFGASYIKEIPTFLSYSYSYSFVFLLERFGIFPSLMVILNIWGFVRNRVLLLKLELSHHFTVMDQQNVA